MSAALKEDKKIETIDHEFHFQNRNNNNPNGCMKIIQENEDGAPPHHQQHHQHQRNNTNSNSNSKNNSNINSGSNSREIMVILTECLVYLQMVQV